MLNVLILLSIDLANEGFVKEEAVAEALRRDWIEPVATEDGLMMRVTEAGRERAAELVESYT